MKQAWAGLTFAFQFLTIIPLPSRWISEATRPTFAIALRWFPVVGLLLGLGLVAIDRVLTPVFSPIVLNVVMLSLYVLVTGGLHQDGIADTADALAGGTTPDHRLEILRDSHSGALGVTALVLSLGLRYAGLLALPGGIREMVLFCMPAIGRWSMVVGVWNTIYPRTSGLAASFIRHHSWIDVAVASTVVGVGLVVLFGPIAALAVLGVGCVLVRWFVWWITRKIGGVTGDILGTINEGVEIIFVLCAPLLCLLS